MKWYLFSELIKNSKTKPDFIIANKIDEIDFPLKHINFIKTNINQFMFDSFSNVVDFQKKLHSTEKDIFNEFGTEKEIKINFNNKYYDIILKKNSKFCPPFKYDPILKFDNKILTEEFIDEINKYYILISLVFAISLEDSFKFIKENKDNYNLNCRFVYDEILSFWTNNFKNDFCYFGDKDLGNRIFEERELEFCIIQFYFNQYKKELIDTSYFVGEKQKILNRIINDKANYKWYVIFGVAIFDKIKDKFKNSDESILQGVKRIKSLNYKIIHKIFDDLIN